MKTFNKNLLTIILLLIVLISGKSFTQQFNRNVQNEIMEVLWEEGVENAYPRWSKDRKQILYQSNRTGNWQIFVMDRDGSNQMRITNDNYNNKFPDWSPDNKKIAFVSDRDGNEEVYIRNVDGSELINLSNNSERDIHPYFSPDGKKILFNSSRDDKESFEIYSINIDGSELKRLTHSKDVETCARFSPDGKKIVYLKGTPGGNDDVRIMNFDGSGEREITKTDSNEGWPVWKSDGETVLFSSTLEGSFSLYEQNINEDKMNRISYPEESFLDARATVSKDGKELVFNRQTENTIGIFIMKLGDE